MYHRVGEGKHANTYQTFVEHLENLARYRVVLPGEKLSLFQLSVCLTFDDATYDFYHYVFPLLKQFNMRAILGVPVRYIMESTNLCPEERLAVPYTLAMQDGFFDKKVPFCTWDEIKEMLASGHVHIASHSFMHANLTFPFVDLKREVVTSKEILEKRLGQPVSSFIYPFGKVNKAVHAYVKQHYSYAFRIGSALNFGWGNGLIRRINADNCQPQQLLSRKMKLIYMAKGVLAPQ